ncbi:Retrovirus-related Pol polyprotein from transposon TNT 1-94 [Araneus ventricosus]|uniref:Retrovirus-related Pol polyprotein from transposon TNT 1-94 n=1 Tax=Araneus ventricosus TaxID=182803 RepID=A0A4Y2US96_ARAVE|nr:Retrovirus-related Pol polyprotein from transposon TNT 1-94 [Araneus ventricosus]
MDLCGPFPKASIHGHGYFLTIIDYYSRRVFAYPLKTKSDVLNTSSRFQKRDERFLDRKIKCIRTDNGLEFINEQFYNFCDELGIKHERTNTYTPQQNGVSERFNYTAVDGINVLLKDSGLGQDFWSEALLHFVYTWNRICHSNQSKTPFELYGGKRPSIKTS